MTYNFNGKNINIPDVEIEKSMRALELTRDEAIEMWLDDHDYTVNEEQVALDAAAAGVVKVQVGGKPRKQSKPRTVKVSDEKQDLFNYIVEALDTYDATVVKENKLIQIKVGDKVFKLDLVEQRKKS